MSPTSDERERYELKFALGELAFERVRGRMELHRSALRRQFPPRRVHSLYFDRADEPARLDGVEGNDERAKLRLRWYGDAAHGVGARFERKSRRGALVVKSVAELARPLDIEHERCDVLARTVRELLPQPWRALFEHDERPVQWISYAREYLRSASSRVRVTIDRELAAWDQRFVARVSRGVRTPLPRVVVVELKAAPENADELRDVATALGVRVDKCSKFRLAADPYALGFEPS